VPSEVDPKTTHLCRTTAQHSIDAELEKALGTDRVKVRLGAAATITSRGWDHRGHRHPTGVAHD